MSLPLPSGPPPARLASNAEENATESRCVAMAAQSWVLAESSSPTRRLRELRHLRAGISPSHQGAGGAMVSQMFDA